MTLAVFSSRRRIGEITLAGAALSATSAGLQDVADAALARHGGSAQAAYDSLRGFTNGYITIIDAAPAADTSVGLAFDPSEPRDPHTGQWIQLWHGTSLEKAKSINATGLRGTYSPEDPTLSPDRQQSVLMPYELDPSLKWPDNPNAVLDVRVPADREHEYLFPPHPVTGFRALRKPLPPEMIHGYKIEPYYRGLKSGRPASTYEEALETSDDGGLAAQLLDLAFSRAEARDDKGRWTRVPGTEAGSLGPLLIPAGVKRKASRTRPVITAAEARGNSRPVSYEEFQHLAALGNSWIDRAKRDSQPITGLDRNWDVIKDHAYGEAQKPWGGATIDAHSGIALASDADKYALSVKPKGMDTVSVPETASREEFGAAMDRARELFRPALERRGFHLGVFHDDETGRIDIDPVAIVDSPALVEQVGSYTRAIGGAFHFKSGDGFWPPHVAEAKTMAGGETTIHFEGPGQWHTQAVAVQEPEPDDEAAEE